MPQRFAGFGDGSSSGGYWRCSHCRNVMILFRGFVGLHFPPCLERQHLSTSISLKELRASPSRQVTIPRSTFGFIPSSLERVEVGFCAVCFDAFVRNSTTDLCLKRAQCHGSTNLRFLGPRHWKNQPRLSPIWWLARLGTLTVLQLHQQPIS